ncbi:MAG: glycosyltransferase family 4 protein [Candidatus Margulisiibacteriota bacterium]
MNKTSNSTKSTVAIIGPDTLPIPPFRGGGIQTCVWETVSHFRKYRATVYSGLPEENIKEVPLREEHSENIFIKIPRNDLRSHLIRVSHLQFNNYFPYVYQIAHDINRNRPEIVHVHSRCWFLPYLNILLKYRPKYILQHHNHYFEDMTEKQVNSFMRMIDAFIGVSNYTCKTEVLNRFPEYTEKVHVIHNGVNLEKYRPKWACASESILKIKSEYNIQESEKIILFVGRVVNGKGVEPLILAFQKIADKYPGWKMMIVGSSWFGETIKDEFLLRLKKISEPIKEKILFTGFVPNENLPAIYSIADIFSAPSIMEEPFGLVFVEAMASGLPVIASERGGIPDVVVQGQTGFLAANPDDPAEIAEILQLMISGTEKSFEFGRAGRKRVEQFFSWQEAADKTEDLYDKVLGK